MYFSIVTLSVILTVGFAISAEVNKDWLQEILVRNDKLHDIKEIISLKSTPAVENVTTFGSEDRRITMELLLEDGTKSRKSLILKSLPSTPALRKQIADSGIFTIEIKIYKDALSKMEQVLYDNRDNSEPLWIRSLGYKEYEDLLLEDIVQEYDYKTADRWTGLDLPHSLLAVKGLAKFHAISAVANAVNNNKIQEEFGPSLLERNYEGLGDFYAVVYKNFADVIEEKWGAEWKTAADKIRTVAPDVKKRLLKLYTDNTFINTLNLGASTTRNIFFKYHITDLQNSENPIAVRFSYFQISFFNSPVHDLQYFINTSPNLDVMIKHRDEVLSAYYHALVHFLNKFGYNGKIPTMEEFQNEVKRTNFEGITIAIQILPLIFEPQPIVDNSEKNAEQNQKSNTSILDKYGMITKEYEHYMKALLKIAFDNNVL